jgi:SHS2 domain-containing protein
MYEFFEHTADLGIRAVADDLPGLFAEAGRALTAAMVENPDDVQARDSRPVVVAGARHDELMHDWLAELLYLHEVDHLLLCRFDVALTPDGLTATVHGEPYDPDRHELDAQIKAITYHRLRVESTGDHWLAEVIADL